MQFAWLEPSEDRVHGLAGPKLPDPSVENVTWPVGLVAPRVAVSVTLAVRVEGGPPAPGDGQDNKVGVGSNLAGRGTGGPPKFFEKRGAKTADTRTHTFR